MRAWDLTSGAAKLSLALENLQRADAAIAAGWTDEQHARFREAHLRPLLPQVRKSLDAIQRLADVLRKAQRECGEE